MSKPKKANYIPIEKSDSALKILEKAIESAVEKVNAGLLDRDGVTVRAEVRKSS